MILRRLIFSWRRRFAPCGDHHWQHIGRDNVCRRCGETVPFVRFSHHAVERFVSRVHPTLSTRQALRKLVSARRAGGFTTERPAFARLAQDADAYLVVAEDVAVVLKPVEDCWLGVTTISKRKAKAA